MQFTQRMRKAKIAGPVFISIGDPEKLQIFLDAHPDVNRDSFLVDDYSFAGYDAIGFGNFQDSRQKMIAGSRNIRFPRLRLDRWRQYLMYFRQLAPIPKKIRGVPEGVTRIGGTIALRKEEIVYVYEDGVPGDYPNPGDVLDALL